LREAQFNFTYVFSSHRACNCFIWTCLYLTELAYLCAPTSLANFAGDLI